MKILKLTSLKALFLTSGLLLFAWVPAYAQTDLAITEFLALNNSGLPDENGQYEDWIEIHNPSAAMVNLAGWYLTDNSSQLTKWPFPSTNLAAHSYLVVFASGNNRTTVGQPLHTNFRMSGDGEFLALVGPATNIVSQYTPRFPAQRTDTSYGLGMVTGPLEFLIQTGAIAKALAPLSDIGLTWTETGFDDSTWITGPTGMGFDTSTNYDHAIGLDIESQMLNVNSSAYLRVPFNVADPSQFQEMKLRLNYDDGFIAYLNGAELARRNAPETAAWNSAATTAHGSEPGVAGTLSANFDSVTDAYNSIHFEGQTGQTTASASEQSGDAGSTGRFLRLINDGVLYQGNSIAFAQTAPGRFPLIIADFDFRIGNTLNGDPADGFSFMIIPTATYGTSGSGAYNTWTAVEEPNYAGVFAVGFDVYPHASQNDVSAHWNGVEYLNVTIPRTTIEMVAGQFHHCQTVLEYAPDGSGAYVTVVITPNVNLAPGAPLTAINRIFIAGLTSYDCRVEFAGRTGGLDMNVDLDNINVQFGYPKGLVPTEEFDVSMALTHLQAGDNVLAIHGLNIAATNGDFLILPQLLGRNVALQTDSQFFFDEPTPGAINSLGEADIAQAAQFSVPSGLYTNTFEVELSSTTPGAVIRYTLDGSVPTEESPDYLSSLSVTSSVMVSARVFAPNYLPSSVASRSYTMLDSTAAQFRSKLPLVIINTFGRVLFQDMDPRVTASVAVIDKPKLAAEVTLLDPPDYHGRAGVEGRGQTSWGFAKKPMNIELRDDNDMDQDVSLLGMPAESDWILLNPYSDKTLMNNFLAFEMHEQMGHYAVRRRFVEVFLNGRWDGGAADPSSLVGTNDYVGVYVLLERIKIDNDRVDIARLAPEDDTEPNITGGYIWKKDKNSPDDVNFTLPHQPINAGDAMKFHDPRGQDLTPVQRDWLVNHLTEFENVLYGSNWRDPVNGYAKYIEVDSFVDNHWIVEFTKQIDGYRLSNFMHKDRGGKIKMDPIWDWNLSLGNANYLEGGMTNGWYYPLISEQQHIWLRRLIASPGDPDFNQLIVDRWGELRGGVFNGSNLLARVTEITNYIYEAALRDHARWPRLSGYVWPNPDGANLVPTGTDGTTAIWDVNYATPGTYANLIGQMKNWIAGRYAWIDSLYLRAPEFTRYAGEPEAPLGISAPLGTIYYTLDGSDPRLPGGLVSPNAVAYSGEFAPGATARIIARAWHTNSWSPPAKANFGDPIPSLAVTEIMYHPEPGLGFNDEDFEYLELINTGATDLDLSGIRLVGGANFTFPTGPLVTAGTDTANDFDAAGTAYTASTLGTGPGAVVTAGGPAGSFIRMVTQATGVNRNRITFDQTATGPYDILTADFDFRGNNATPPPVAGPPTLQDFDHPGTTYALRSYDTTEPNTPIVTGPDAGSSGQYVRLSREVGSESGGIFFDATAPTAYNYVVMDFDFRMTATGTPADGMGLVFLNTANWGASGATASGWSEEPNMAGSLGIGFDNYLNAISANEPNANHVSLHWNGGQVAGAAATPGFSMVAGAFHHAQVIITFEATRALITVKLTPNVNGASGPTETLFENYVVNGSTAYRGRLAFAARTGGSWANHEIDNVNVQYLSTPPAAAGGLSLLLLPASAFGTTGAGTTTSDFQDQPNVPNTFALDLSMHSSDLFNDITLHWDGSSRGSSTLPPDVLNLDDGMFHHAHVEVARNAEGSLVSVTLTPDVFGTPGTPIEVLSDAFIAGLSPADARVEFAGRSGGMDLGIDLENVQVSYAKYAPNLLAPNERILLVSSNAAFQARYGPGLPVAGEFVGHLNNNSERLRLVGPFGEPILDFSYNDAWYPLTDGNGFSLVFPDPQLPSAAWNNSQNWRPSSVVGGSPGQPGSEPVMIAPVVVNEVLSHSQIPEVDAIEIHNPTGVAVEVSDWYLTDDFNTPKKFRIPNGTEIPAAGYWVFLESEFNPAPGSPTSFGLSAEGDQVYLFSGNAAGELTGYYHGFDFGPAEANVSFGRHVISTGKEHFVAQSALTLGANNAGPKVGPVVISEIMYHPLDYPGAVNNSEDEYIELSNISDSPAPLFDEVYTNNTWRLRDAVDFEFPQNTIIPVDGRVLVVSFNPLQEPSLLTSFRAAYGLDATVAIFGPYGGKLDNSEDSVELTKPSDLDPDTLLPDYILVDKVKYSDALPWPPAADGAGPSLQRVNITQYGNDPINWMSAYPRPGQPFPGGTPPVITGHPQSQTVVELTSASFDVTVDGAGPFEYLWRHNGGLIPGATNSTLLLPSVQYADQGDYSAIVIKDSIAVASSNATLSVIPVPTILVPPEMLTVASGATTNLSVVATGTGPLSYQWRRNGQDISGATSSSYTVSNIQFDDNDGAYTVVVTDTIGSRESEPGYLIVKIRPIIDQTLTVEPSTNILEGRDFTLSVTASGGWPMTFRFRSPTTNDFATLEFFSNHNTANLLVENAKTNLHDGGWDCGITGPGGQNLTRPKLIINVLPAAPFFTLNPAGQTAKAGQTIVLDSEARGTDPITYQWYWNGTTGIPDATNAILELSQPQSSDAGQYTVVASNLLGMATSTVAQVSIEAGGLQILAQPANQNVTVCEDAVFTVAATGAAPLTYQWYLDGTQALPGANANTLTLSKPAPMQAGNYTVVVTDSSGSITSQAALLTLLLGDQDSDDMSDEWELAHGLNPCDPADRNLDPDEDRHSNWQESVGGTDPNNKDSVLRVILVDGGNGGARVQFRAEANVSYTILYRADVTPGDWDELAGVPAEGQPHDVDIPDPGAGTNGFRVYRIVTPMRP